MKTVILYLIVILNNGNDYELRKIISYKELFCSNWYEKNIEFRNESLWKTDLSEFDLIFIYFIPHRMKKLEKKIRREMKPGIRIISNGFIFPDWQYLQKDDNIYLYEI